MSYLLIYLTILIECLFCVKHSSRAWRYKKKKKKTKRNLEAQNNFAASVLPPTRNCGSSPLRKFYSVVAAYKDSYVPLYARCCSRCVYQARRVNCQTRERASFSCYLSFDESDQGWYPADIMAVSVVKIVMCSWVNSCCLSPVNAQLPVTLASVLIIPWLPHDPGTKGLIVIAGPSRICSDYLASISI